MPLHPPAWTTEWNDEEKNRLMNYLQSIRLWREFKAVQKSRMRELKLKDAAYALRREEQSWRETWEDMADEIAEADEAAVTGRVEKRREESEELADLTPAEVATLAAKPEISFADEVRWVYDNFSSDPKPEDAPSQSTWGLYKWATAGQARAKFYGDLVPRFIAAPQEEAEKATKAKTGGNDKLVELIEKLQEEAAAGRARTVTCPQCQTEVPCPVRYGGDLEDSVLEVEATA